MGSACSAEEREELKAVQDDDAKYLSYIGQAANAVLEKKHGKFWHKLWNVTSGKVIGEVHQTPHLKVSWVNNQDPPTDHDNWFPENMSRIMSKTQVWCDITSLGPPDGRFMEAFQRALKVIAKTASDGRDPIIIRMMFGNIVGMPVNCDALITSLTEGLAADANIQLWVGAWRKGVSWNHSKIIAVDGQYLHNGGHNLWDPHYLSFDPVHDLSMEAEGRVAQDGHLYANEQWAFVEQEQGTLIGKVVSSLPDNMPMMLQTRVTISEWPEGIDEFPPNFTKAVVPRVQKVAGSVPMITMGRYGCMKHNARPSDEAFVAMFDSAKTIIHCALQDLGPITLPGLPGPVAVPGCGWPKEYLSAFGRAIWDRDVDIEIALSNPGSVPGGLSPTEALYGNGWTCADVAAEVIKTIQEQYLDVNLEDLTDAVNRNLRVCYIKQRQGGEWNDKKTMGMHAKHFIIDDRAYYIGSQNLYVCDLAEWGIVIDDPAQTKKCMDEYWNPLWAASFTGTDCDCNDVIAGLDVDRDGGSIHRIDKKTKELMAEAERASHKVPEGSEHHHDGD